MNETKLENLMKGEGSTRSDPMGRRINYLVIFCFKRKGLGGIQNINTIPEPPFWNIWVFDKDYAFFIVCIVTSYPNCLMSLTFHSFLYIYIYIFPIFFYIPTIIHLSIYQYFCIFSNIFQYDSIRVCIFQYLSICFYIFPFF